MFKILAFLCKKEGMSREQLIDYYENRHVPLIRSLAGVPPLYRRKYLVADDALNFLEDGTIAFDVVTEIGFPERADFIAWIAKLGEPGIGEQVAADEAKFLDRAKTRGFVVDERITT